MQRVFRNIIQIIFVISFFLFLTFPAAAETASAEKKPAAKKAEVAAPQKKSHETKKAAAKNDKKGSTEGAEKKAAVVNGSVITKKSFDQEVAVMRAQFEQSGQKIEDSQAEEFKKHVMNQLISTELLYQDSKQKGITVSDEQLSNYLGDVKKRFPSAEEYKKGLANMNMTEDEVKVKLRKKLAIEELINKHVAMGSDISEDEAKSFYDNSPELFQAPESVKASHILIKVAPDAKQSDKDAAMKKIKEIQEKIKKGEDFGELAKKNSECPSAPNGGDLGYFSKGQMVAPFENAAFGLEPNTVSNIVETQFGYHIIKVTDKKKSEKIPFETAKDRIKQNLGRDKKKQKIDEHIRMLTEKAKIEKFI